MADDRWPPESRHVVRHLVDERGQDVAIGLIDSRVHSSKPGDLHDMNTMAPRQLLDRDIPHLAWCRQTGNQNDIWPLTADGDRESGRTIGCLGYSGPRERKNA